MYTFGLIICAMTAVFGFVAIAYELLVWRYIDDDEGANDEIE